MADDEARPPSGAIEDGSPSAPHILTYRPRGAAPTVEAPGLVPVASLLHRDTARIVSTVLEGEGIRCHIFNENSDALGPYATGIAGCELQVAATDAAAATAIVRQIIEHPDSIEPADIPPGTPPPRSEEGGELIVAGEYDHPRSLQEAAAVLGSARIRPYLPRLVAHGDRPAGTGSRFLLRVEADEADRARSVLDDAREEAEEDARERRLVRCPKCNRLTGERTPRAWQWIVAFLKFRSLPDPEAHCAPCRHLWTVDE